jgi:hypothetical protein
MMSFARVARINIDDGPVAIKDPISTQGGFWEYAPKQSDGDCHPLVLALFRRS